MRSSAASVWQRWGSIGGQDVEGGKIGLTSGDNHGTPGPITEESSSGQHDREGIKWSTCESVKGLAKGYLAELAHRAQMFFFFMP